MIVSRRVPLLELRARATPGALAIRDEQDALSFAERGGRRRHFSRPASGPATASRSSPAAAPRSRAGSTPRTAWG